MPQLVCGNGIKMDEFDILIPIGSITGDPIGVRRYMKIKRNQYNTSTCESVLLKQDGTEYKNPYCREV